MPKENTGKAAEPHAIVKEPHKVLRKKAAGLLVHDITAPKIQRLIADMKTTLAATPDGVGLAAPQIGESLRLFIVSEEAEEIGRSAAEIARDQRHGASGTADMAISGRDTHSTPGNNRQRDWRYYVFINPVIKNHSRRMMGGTEGCLSVPGTFGEVARYEKLTVEAHDEHGKKFTRNCSRFFARVVQHELDHLEGTLFIDKAKDLMQIPERKKEDDKH